MASQQQQNSHSCSMVGLLGIIIQVALGVLSFSVLIIKRFREKPRRPWKIWFFDTSKQLISQIIAHFINLTISLALAASDSSSDQCLWYFITNILDNTVGVLICVGCLKLVELILTKRGKNEYLSGNYYSKQKITVQIQIMDLVLGEVKDTIMVKQDSTSENSQIPTKSSKNNKQKLTQQQQPKNQPASQLDSNPRQTLQKYRVNYKAWLVQLAIWVAIVVVGKSVIFGFEFGLQNPLKNISSFLMGWIEKYPVFELILVMVIVPVCMNGLAFWVQDNFLMKKDDSASNQSPLIEQRDNKIDIIDLH